jgi:urea transport system substrate-binding protein
MKTRTASRMLRGLLAISVLAVVACGSDSKSSSDAKASTATTGGGGTVKVGVLQSLSGTMSISEVAVKNSELLAIKEINAKGGVLGKQI